MTRQIIIEREFNDGERLDCISCGNFYNKADVIVLCPNSDMTILHVKCRSCRMAALVKCRGFEKMSRDQITPLPGGNPAVITLATDVNADEALRISRYGDSVKADDVLETHELVEASAEDFIDAVLMHS